MCSVTSTTILCDVAHAATTPSNDHARTSRSRQRHPRQQQHVGSGKTLPCHAVQTNEDRCDIDADHQDGKGHGKLPANAIRDVDQLHEPCDAHDHIDQDIGKKKSRKYDPTPGRSPVAKVHLEWQLTHLPHAEIRQRTTAARGTTAPTTATVTKTTRSVTATPQPYEVDCVDSRFVRVVIQRATSAEVIVDNTTVGTLTSPGLVVLIGVTSTDTATDAEKLAEKIWRLRILADEKSASDLDAPLLVVSQFTLYASTRKGRRPSWSAAAPGSVSEPLVDHFVTHLRSLGAHVETGIFGADMKVGLVNDGPMMILIDTDDWR